MWMCVEYHTLNYVINSDDYTALCVQDVLDYLIRSEQVTVLLFWSRYTRCIWVLKIRKK